MPFKQPFTTTGQRVADATVLGIVYGALISNARDGIAILDGINTVPWAVLSGSTYTVNRDFFPSYYETAVGITVEMASASGIFRGYCRGDVLNNGVTRAKGADAVGPVAGAAWGTTGTLGNNVAGGAGGTNTNANGTGGGAASVEFPIPDLYQGGPGGGGNASNGGAGGTVTTLAANRGALDGLNGVFAMFMTQALASMGQAGSGGGGGGSGAAASSSSGGGGGASGPDFVFWAGGRITNNGTMGSFGGNGGNGQSTDAGAGGPGAGGRVFIGCAEWVGNEAESLSGIGGAAPGGTGKTAGCGLPSRIRFFPPRTWDGRLVEDPVLVTLSPADLVSINTAGVVRLTLTSRMWNEPGINTGVFSTSRGGGGFPFVDGTSADGRFALLYSPTTNDLKFIVRGATIATMALNVTAPTAQTWSLGDKVDIDLYYDPSGQYRVRMAVNNVMGLDTAGSGTGGALAAFSSMRVLGSAEGIWRPTSTVFSALAPTANAICRIVWLGDSNTASRSITASLGSFMGMTNGLMRTLATPGARLDQQIGTWQSCPERGQAACEAVIVGPLGGNDIVAGDSAVQLSTEHQAIITDIAANNPLAKIIGVQMIPMSFFFTPAQQAVWVAQNANINGTGANNITGQHQVVTAHVAQIGDPQFAQRDRGDSTDHVHISARGRRRLAVAVAAKLAAAGVSL